ncbi:MAG: SUMF1/EgtB/PvdO family nonheme iron enzyme [Deltaproteobacteria bacterium]|nr:SUMF1/EgtB/PvdO family nonheme iron enzyme [Deltaproteobacteria bacterium]
MIDFAEVANPANPPEGTGFGAVANVYSIAPHEVTHRQYAAFLNAVADDDPNGLFHATSEVLYFIRRTGDPGSYHYTVFASRDARPINFVSLYDAMRFANWLHNGQPTGPQDVTTTEDGAYDHGGGRRRERDRAQRGRAPLASD